jgi:hypothetical protein
MHRIISLFIAILLLTACQHQTDPNARVWKVEVATSECNGWCQRTLTVVDSNLNYHFFGGRVAKGGAPARKGKLFGFYTAKVSRRFWDSLTTSVGATSWQSLDTGYRQENDVQFLEILVHYGNRVKLIHRYESDLPADLRQTIYWVADSYVTIKPVASKDTFKTAIKDWEGWWE